MNVHACSESSYLNDVSIIVFQTQMLKKLLLKKDVMYIHIE